MLEAHRRAALLQQSQRRLDQRRAQSLAGNERPASPAANGERLANDCARQPRGSQRRIDIQRRDNERLDQTLVERSLASDDLANGLARGRPEKSRQRQIIERACPRHPPARIENPERHRAVVEAQRPAFTAQEIDKREFGVLRTDKPIRGTDVAQIVERGVITGKQEMVAVVDRHADRSIVIGATAAASEGGGFVYDDGFAERREPHSGGQAGKAGADNVDRSAHPITRDFATR